MKYLARRLLAAWDRFLFESCEPIVCSMLRIPYAILLMIYVIIWMLDAERWFTDSGVLRAETADRIGGYEYWSLLFWLPSTLGVVMTCLTILLLQSLLMLLGCWSRFQAACIFMWLTSFQHRNALIVDGEDTVFRWVIFFMIFMPLDYAWSLRSWFRRWRNGQLGLETAAGLAGRSSAWALRLLQFEITAIYISTAWSKWQGITWRDGTALYYVSRMDDLFGRFWIPDSMFETAWIVKSMTWAVLGLESLLPLMLWCRLTRRLAIVAGITLHLCIEYGMHLFLFEWVMIVGLLSFVRPHEWPPLNFGWLRRQATELPHPREA
ncbi:MAG: HTTM domain-containing protein [Planctomycetales bacterium]|nr:HTTM domain-containing protein [Planctomycetales bacterium]